MNASLSVLTEFLGIRRAANTPVRLPEVGEVYIYRPEIGPVEYAEVVGVYKEAADIGHIRFRLHYGYQDKTIELGERTLAASLFHRRFAHRIPTEDAAAE